MAMPRCNNEREWSSSKFLWL